MGEIVNAVNKKGSELQNKIQAQSDAIVKSLPKHIDPVKFMRDVFTAVSTTPKLKECDYWSVISAFATSAQLGLMPNNSSFGEAWVIPYKYKGVQKAQFQLGYQGALTLAYRNKKVLSCFAREVRDTDDFVIDLASGYVKHIPTLTGKSGKIIGYYAVLKLVGDVQNVEYMSQEDMDDFSTRYTNDDSSAWNLSPEAMSKKTVLKRLLKYAPKSLDIQELFNYDGVVSDNLDNSNTSQSSSEDFINAEEVLEE